MKAKRINCIIFTFLALMSIVSMLLLYLEKVYEDKLAFEFSELIQALSLILIVFFLRSRINKVQAKLAKTKLVMVHLINFILYVVLSILRYNSESHIIYVAFVVLNTIMHLFIISLVISFTRNMQQTKKFTDHVLRKEVPLTVFL